MNVLILGSGGREHAFAWKVKQSSQLKKLFVAPGNAGTESLASNVELDHKNFEEIGEFCIQNTIDLVIVGPEAPLVDGIFDFFKTHSKLTHISILGPDKIGAQLEGSKDFSKKFMLKHGIPTASAKTFDQNNLHECDAFFEKLTSPIVLKADGLAAGKGVLIIEDKEEAKNELFSMIQDKKFGSASQKVLVETFLNGIELSVFVLTDGKNYLILPEAKDYKRIGDNDTGLNTGGMGAVSPVPFADEAFMQSVEEKVIIPTLKGLQAEKIDYRGFLFIGLMKVGVEPFVIEYNVRMGDPETEVVLPRIKSDLLPLFKNAADGALEASPLELSDETALTLMHVSGGYPENYEKGKEIIGLDAIHEAVVFHAGTKSSDGKIMSNGGRVISLTAMGKTIEACREKAYRSSDLLRFEKCFRRSDIGKDLL